MSKTLLQITQEFCRRTGLDVPSIVAASQDSGVLQFMGLMNEVVEDVTMRGESWPRLQRQATWVSTGTVGGLQGAITTLFPYGFQYIIWETSWDRTLRRRLFGPKSAQAWQQALALPFTGPFYAYRIQNGNLYVQPDLTAGHTMALEYASNYAVLAADGVTYKGWFTVDTDVFLLDEGILLRGLKAFWKREKGLAWAADYAAYESYLSQSLAQKGDQMKLSMDSPNCEDPIKPGIFVSAGSWAP